VRKVFQPKREKVAGGGEQIINISCIFFTITNRNGECGVDSFDSAYDKMTSFNDGDSES
jgi:hypothetical protein